jgi:hypothetical protein
MCIWRHVSALQHESANRRITFYKTPTQRHEIALDTREQLWLCADPLQHGAGE